MSRMMDFIGSEGFSLERYPMDQLAPTDGELVLSRALLYPKNGEEISQERLDQLSNDLCRLKYLDDHVLEWYQLCYPYWTLQECEVVHVLGNMVFGVLPVNKEAP